jgi:ankyrin repeat protein
MFMAAKNGSAQMLDLLLKAGAEADTANGTGTTPLMLAAASGKVDAVQVLLAHGANVNAREKTWGETPLMFAAAMNRAEVVKLLISKGADAKVTTLVARLDTSKGYDADGNLVAEEHELKNDKPLTPEEQKKAEAAKKAAERRRQAAAMRAAQTMGGMSALHFAVRDGQMEAVHALVESGVDINLVSAADQTSPLLESIYNGHYDIAQYLFEHGANPKLVNADGLAPVYAVIDQQWANRTWYPPASSAQEKTNYLTLLKEFLDAGADPNVQVKKKVWFRRFHDDWIDSPGATAFWRAAQANDLDAVKLLVAYGADPNIKTIHKASALQVAAGYGVEDQLSAFKPGMRLAVVKYLVDDLHMDVNNKDDHLYTPLHGAAYLGANDVVLYLLGKGADISVRSTGVISQEGQDVSDAPNHKGDTVVDMANGPRTHGFQHFDTIKLLESFGGVNSHNCRSDMCLPDVNASHP